MGVAIRSNVADVLGTADPSGFAMRGDGHAVWFFPRFAGWWFLGHGVRVREEKWDTVVWCFIASDASEPVSHVALCPWTSLSARPLLDQAQQVKRRDSVQKDMSVGWSVIDLVPRQKGTPRHGSHGRPDLSSLSSLLSRLSPSPLSPWSTSSHSPSVSVSLATGRLKDTDTDQRIRVDTPNCFILVERLESYRADPPSLPPRTPLCCLIALTAHPHPRSHSAGRRRPRKSREKRYINFILWPSTRHNFQLSSLFHSFTTSSNRASTSPYSDKHNARRRPRPPRLGGPPGSGRR